MSGDQSKAVPAIGLADVLASLRNELKQAQQASDPNNPLFVDDIEVEIQAVVTENDEFKVNGKGKGKIELKVLDFFKVGEFEAELGGEGKGAWGQSTTQKIKLKLSAKHFNAVTGSYETTQVGDEGDC